jgi:hypothetical protein
MQTDRSLRFKYRDPANVPVRKNGAYKNRTGNSHGSTKVKDRQGTGPRRRQGLGAVGG